MTINPRLTAALSDRYTIDREIGQGGMATVYLAHDVRHDRNVALKVLRPELAAVIGAERFLAEIKTLAKLQHPHILPLHDSGEADGTVFYVMPYVEGESLRDRLNKEKQLPVDESIRIAREIAGALDYAHRHGIVHRDIKPENILLHDGQALIADFGIALAVSRSEGSSRMTETGMSLGTPTYMAPEQAMGEREISLKADVYALGCVLYEMLTGDPPFTGSTAQAIVARAMTEQPRSIVMQRHTVPAYVEAAVLTALEKLPADRFATAGEFAEALQDGGVAVSRTATARAAAAATQERTWRTRFRDPVVIALSLVSVAAISALLFGGRGAPQSSLTRAVRFAVSTNDSLRAGSNFPWPAAISPNGEVTVFSARHLPDPPMLFSRRIDQLEAHPIPGTEDAYQPLFSPDGQWVAFEVEGKEKKVRLDGSAPVNITEGGASNGADWSSRDELILGSTGTTRGLSRVSVAGGDRVTITRPDSAKGEHDHVWPIAFPDGKTVAFVVWSGDQASARLALTSVSSGKVVPLHLKGLRPLAVLDEKLIYVQADGAVMAVAIDQSGMKVRGEPMPVHEPVGVTAGLNGNSDIFVSKGGALVTSNGTDKSMLGWMEHDRSFHPVVSEVRAYGSPRISPDGKKIAVIQFDARKSDLWILDLATSTMSRLTTIESVTGAEWTRDSKSLLIAGARGEFWLKSAEGATPPQSIGKFGEVAPTGTLSPDGKSLVVQALAGSSFDLLLLSRDSTVAPKRYIATPANEWSPRFSPDGRWIVMASTESGRNEVYIRSFPDPSSRVQISVNEGAIPVWSPDGKAITYQTGDALIRARTTGAPDFKVIARDTVLRGTFRFASDFDMSADGKRALVAIQEGHGAQLVAVPNWLVEFRERIKAAGKK